MDTIPSVVMPDRHPCVTISHGNSTSEYGLTNTAAPTIAPATERPVVLDREQDGDKHDGEEEVRLAEQQLVAVELRHQHNREPQQNVRRVPRSGQCGDRPAQQGRDEANLDGKPEQLRCFRVEHAERRHQQRKGRQYLNW